MQIFHISFNWWFFRWSLSDIKSPHVNRTLLSINNAVVCMVSSLFLIVNSSSFISQPLRIIPNVPITIGITITFMFHSLSYSSWDFYTCIHWWSSIEVCVTASLQDSSQYSGWSQQCCSLDGLYSSFDFQFLQSFFQAFRDYYKCTNYNFPNAP